MSTKGNNQNGSKYDCLPCTDNTTLQALAECIIKCNNCAKKCKEEGHKTTAALCSECAEICTITHKFISCNSEYSQELLTLCSKICQKCCEECCKVNTKHCQDCADACRRCCECCAECVC